jgi:hypothetical protein
MHTYTAYNLGIHSEIGLPELPPSHREADIVIRYGSAKIEAENYGEHQDAIFATVDQVGAFFIRQGCEVVIDPVAAADAAHLRTMLLGPVFAILLRQRGLLVLHASAVKIGDQAVAFMGGSGWGKSTLVTAFHHRGATVLTDDVLALDLNYDHPLVLPAYPHFKLCPDAAESFGNQAVLAPIFSGAGKLAYHFTEGFQQTPLPLDRIYILGKGDRHAIVPIAPQMVFMELVQHTRAMIHLTEEAFLTSHFQLCTQLLNTTPFSRFIRKPALADLPILMDLIEADVAQTSLQPDLVNV